MKKVITFFAICLVAQIVSAQDDISQSKWFSIPVMADGVVSEWNQPLNLYDAGSKIFFQMANDSNNLYLCFQVQDIEEQMRIISSGMNVGLQIKAKKKIKASIKFPLKDDETLDIINQEPRMSKKPDIKEIRGRVKLTKTLMEIEGFATPDGTISIKERGKINVGIDLDAKNVMCYEVSIPFNELYGEGFLRDNLKEVVTLKINIDAPKRPTINGGEPPTAHDGGGGAGGNPPSGGMRPGGGMRSGGMGPHSDGPKGSVTFSVQEFKQKFRLTIK